MGKYLFSSIVSPSGEESSASIQFAAIRIDGIFQMVMDQYLRVMYVANTVPEAQCSKIQSVRFEDSRPLLVSYNQEDRTEAHRFFCEMVRDGIDNHISSGMPFVMDVKDEFIDNLNFELPSTSVVDIDMDGYALTWTFMFKYSHWEAYVPYLKQFIDVRQLTGE